MEVEEGNDTFPEELVEKIIAMLPFPSIFKARALSKSWLAKFSSISSQHDDEEKKRVAKSFQKRVSLCANNWARYCPVFIGREDIIGYDQAAQNWRRLSSISFLLEGMFQNWRKLPSVTFLLEGMFLASQTSFLARSYYQIEGAILFTFARMEIDFYQHEMYVANILTRSWKQLPSFPKEDPSIVLCSKLVTDNMGSDSYKVILFCQDARLNGFGSIRAEDEFDHYNVQIYDSKSDVWSTQKFMVTRDFLVGRRTCAYLNGVLYMVAGINPQNLIAFNLTEGTLEEHVLLFNDRMETDSVDLLVCSANRLMMVTCGFYPEPMMQVLEVDLPSMQLLQLSRGPPAPFRAKEISPQPVSDRHGNCIFFRVEEPGTLVLAYNMDEDEWSIFPVPAAASADNMAYKWIGSFCHPGLNPFVAI